MENKKNRWSLIEIVIVLVLSLLTVRGLATADSANPFSPPPDSFVARVYYDQMNDIEQLARYDLWEYNNLHEKYVLVGLDRAGYAQLQQDGWRVSADEAATAALHPTSGRRAATDDYRSVTQLYSDLQNTSAAYPTLTELVKYGESHCKTQGGCTTGGGENLPGFDLLAMRITNEAITGTSTISGTTIISGTKPIFFLMANIHAREITTAELAMHMLDWLLQGYGQDANATWLVDWHEIWIVPTANPDGRWLVDLGLQPPYESGRFYQRKNGNSSGCPQWPPTLFEQPGVDLNRNHSFGWGSTGSSAAPCDSTYHGPSAASETEVAQVQALLKALIPDQRGPGTADAAPPDSSGIFISMHSFSELVLWPWGYTNAAAPNKDGLQAIGDKLATFNGYYSCQPGYCLYNASGTSDDWAYGELGIPALTFEIGTEFMPPYSQIEAVQWPDNGPALQYAAKIARAPYQLVQGPDVTAIETVVFDEETVMVTAVIDDSANGDDSIATAEITINTPYWAGEAATYLLKASDGAFDGTVEQVTAVINHPPSREETPILFVRGRDSAGNWGPVSAVFLPAAQPGAARHYLPWVAR